MHLKQFENTKQRFAPGHKTCRGCCIPIVVRHVLRATEEPVIVVNATGCLEVTSTFHPTNAWNVPYVHTAFACAASTASGIEAALKAQNLSPRPKIIVFGGDGGTYDIGFQALSGMLERGHDITYVCYNNEAYMNTGVQRSSATPPEAFTMTTPGGNKHWRKDIMKVVAGHGVPYAAQASVSHWLDLYNKAKQAIETEGPTFLNILSSCTLGWKHDPSLTVKMMQLAVTTGYWPLISYENGKWTLDLNIEKRKPLEEYLEPQGRFKHLFKPKKNEKAIAGLQNQVNQRWDDLKRMTDG